jgi:hypothetical protein
MNGSWQSALIEYVIDKELSYADIAIKYDVSLDAVKQHAAKEGWVQLRQENTQKIHQKVIAQTAETIAQINERHANTARMLQIKGLTAIESKGFAPNNYREAKDSIYTGITLERKALGLDTPLVQSNTVNVILPDWWLQIPVDQST